MGLHQPLAERERPGALEKKQRSRRDFDQLLFQLSAAFANLPSEAVDRHIETWLEELARFVGVERVTVGEFSQSKPELRATHAYVVPGYAPFPHLIVDEQLPWYTGQIRSGHVVRYEKLPESLPPEAVNERAYCLQHGIQAHLGIPLKVAGSVLGVLAFGSFRAEHSWSDEMVQRLCLVGEILTNALARKRAEERFRTAIDAAPNGMVMIAADGTITMATAPIERMFGYAAEELLGQPVELLLPERYRVQHVRDRSSFLAAPQTRAMGAGRDLYGRRKDGSEVPVEIGLNPIHTAEGPFVLASVIDISERKRGEEALRRSEARKTGMFETALDCIISIDHRGKIVEFNPSAERTFGYRREEVLGRELAELIIPPSLRKRHRQGLTHYLATGEGSVLNRRIEMPAVRADGAEFPVELTVTRISTDGPPLFTAYLRDITERKRSEHALRESQRRLQLMADSLPVLISYVDAERRYQFNNAACARWFGIPAEACKGRPVRDVLGPAAYEAIQEHLNAALAGEPQSFDTCLSYQESGVRDVHAEYVPHRDEFGTVLGFYALIVDVTDRKRADAEAQALKDQLAHVARVATMGELAASIAHEVNQPLCAIVSNAQTAQHLLTKNDTDVEEVRETLQDIIEDGRRASEVIARIRSFLQKDQLETSLVNINGLVREVVALTRRETSRRGAAVTLDLADRLPPVLGDAIQLQQVVLNLMTNALEAMETVEKPLRKLLIRSSHEQPGEIAVAVTDHGIGFKAAEEGRLFEAFFTTKPHGLGMGLAICRSIIQAHGGRLWATPNTGTGATFHFTLPCRSEGSR